MIFQDIQRVHQSLFFIYNLMWLPVRNRTLITDSTLRLPQQDKIKHSKLPTFSLAYKNPMAFQWWASRDVKYICNLLGIDGNTSKQCLPEKLHMPLLETFCNFQINIYFSSLVKDRMKLAFSSWLLRMFSESWEVLFNRPVFYSVKAHNLRTPSHQINNQEDWGT